MLRPQFKLLTQTPTPTPDDPVGLCWMLFCGHTKIEYRRRSTITFTPTKLINKIVRTMSTTKGMRNVIA